MSTSVGTEAESAAARFLQSKGYQIIEQNWRTRFCEIDIVAKYRQQISFVEVKYRSTPLQGTGLDYITPKKLKQMTFAAQCWVEEHKWAGDYNLSAVEVTGDFDVTEFIDSIE